MGPRVLLLTQWFDPEPTFKGMVFARELARRGFTVEVVTGFPNYPGGRVYPGYEIRWRTQERVDGVLVTRVPLYPSHDSSGLRRVANYVSFAATALTYCLFFARRPDVIYAYHPPLTVGIAAAIVRLVRRTPVVLDIQDLWPDTLRATGMFTSERALRLVGRVCAWVYRNVDQIVVLSPGFRRLLIDRGVPDSRLSVIYNWCDEAALTTADRPGGPALPAPSAFRVAFAGNLGKAQALDAVLEAAAILAQTDTAVHFVFIGSGLDTERLQALARSKRLPNVTFVPRVSVSDAGALMRQAEAVLVHLRADPLFEVTIPSKIQAYMALGRPIIVAVGGDAADLVSASGCGVAARSEDPESIAGAVRTLRNSSVVAREAMGAAGRRYYRDHLSLDEGVARFAGMFERLAATNLP